MEILRSMGVSRDGGGGTTLYLSAGEKAANQTVNRAIEAIRAIAPAAPKPDCPVADRMLLSDEVVHKDGPSRPTTALRKLMRGEPTGVDDTHCAAYTPEPEDEEP